MPEVKRRVLAEELRRHPRLPGQPLDEHDIALVYHVEFLGVARAGKRLPVDRLTVAQHADERLLLPVPLRPAEAIELGERVEIALQDSLGLGAADEAAANPVDVPRPPKHPFFQDPDQVGRKNKVSVDPDHHGRAARLESAVDAQPAITVVTRVEGNLDNADPRILRREVLERLGEAVRTRRVGDHDFEAPRREILPRQAFEADPEPAEVPVAGDQDGNPGLVIQARKDPGPRPKAFYDPARP